MAAKKFCRVAEERVAKDYQLPPVANKLAVLNRQSDFEYLKKNGKRLYTSTWVIVNYLPNNLDKIRCGWVISRKIGKAVLRNKFKRWCREFFRGVSKNDYKSVDINIILKVKDESFYKQLKFQEFHINLERAWQKIR